MTLLSRRRFLTILASATAGVRLEAQTIFRRKAKARAVNPNPLVYFATDTAHDGKGIYLARFDKTKGQFTQAVLAAEAVRPAYLALNRMGARQVLYSANEGAGPTSTVSTFNVDPATGSLKLTGQVPSAGNGPCYVALDATEHFCFIANYMGGTVTSYKVQADGTLTQPFESLDFHGKQFGTNGPNARQDGPHPHSSQLSPDNRFLIVNDLGHDDIVVFPLHADGRLGEPNLNSVAAGSGPRHLAFHPNGRWAYGINELANRIDQYLWNTTHGSATQDGKAFLTFADHSVSTLDAGFHGTNTAAEVVVSPEGFQLYASNRGEDSLVVFSIDQASGAPRLVQRISCGGKAPRHFTLDPSGKWLVCGNQDSSSVTVFGRNAVTGMLSGPVQTLPVPSPMFTLFL